MPSPARRTRRTLRTSHLRISDDLEAERQQARRYHRRPHRRWHRPCHPPELAPADGSANSFKSRNSSLVRATGPCPTSARMRPRSRTRRPTLIRGPPLLVPGQLAAGRLATARLMRGRSQRLCVHGPPGPGVASRRLVGQGPPGELTRPARPPPAALSPGRPRSGARLDRACSSEARRRGRWAASGTRPRARSTPGRWPQGRQPGC